MDSEPTAPEPNPEDRKAADNSTGSSPPAGDGLHPVIGLDGRRQERRMEPRPLRGVRPPKCGCWSIASWKSSSQNVLSS